MANGEFVEGALPPLFERLRATVTPDEALPLRSYSARELRESVRRELEGLLNTRSTLTAARYAAAELTVLDYGLPDLTTFAPANADDRRQLASLIVRAIDAYEPRLRGVRVAVEPLAGQPEGLLATVSADLVAGSFAERVTVTAALSTGARDHQVTLQPVEVLAPR